MNEMQPLDWQERHSPTVWELVRVSGSRKENIRKRRKQDARLFHDMTPYQEGAFQLIGQGYLLICGSMGYQSLRLERVDGKEEMSDKMAQISVNYMKWADNCSKNKISHADAVDVIAFGKTINETAKDRRTSFYKIKKNLLGALSLYCEMMGWPAK